MCWLSTSFLLHHLGEKGFIVAIFQAFANWFPFFGGLLKFTFNGIGRGNLSRCLLLLKISCLREASRADLVGEHTGATAIKALGSPVGFRGGSLSTFACTLV